jgi:hypothetical protein
MKQSSFGDFHDLLGKSRDLAPSSIFSQGLKCAAAC